MAPADQRPDESPCPPRRPRWPVGARCVSSWPSSPAVLARPLVARVATRGPTGRPVWYLWQDHAFWVLTGPWTKLFTRVRADPRLALIVGECDLATGVVGQVIARGRGELLPFDVPRGGRTLARYLGADENRWDERFRRYLHDDPDSRGTVWLRVTAESVIVEDLSYSV
ncbi:pyridoxamine 5'-phosphate oxidase family protein [Micromonospora sp. NPDC047670]|uniref:pyridoxamine 5'-phosphate oxidase family protein n=1 Tax=Micromonospora sp. NPDC047670 TaxID=3364252 RepID=UPI00371095D6